MSVGGLASRSMKIFSSIVIDACACISQNTSICMNSDLYFQQTFNNVTMITVLKNKLKKKEKEHHKFYKIIYIQLQISLSIYTKLSIT